MNSPTLSKRAPGQPKSQSRFHRLWAEAEELALENETLHTELEALVRRVGIEVGGAERELGKTVRQAVHRQLDFSEKKSLLKWQRAELSEWVDELLEQLMSMGELDEELQNRLAVMRAREMGVALDENSKSTAAEQLREHMEQQFADEEAFAPDDQDYLDDEDDLEELLRRLQEQFEERNEAPPPPPSADTKAKKTDLDDTVFKRLFRQTAAALHPDKEADPERQREKNELMAELLRARKERDLINIVRLHEQHASAESDLTATDEEQLEEVLIDYLSQQRQRMDSIVHHSPMHEFVYQEFYHNNPATVKKRIKAHIKKIESRREGFALFVDRVKTLKALKEILADRYDENRYFRHW